MIYSDDTFPSWSYSLRDQTEVDKLDDEFILKFLSKILDERHNGAPRKKKRHYWTISGIQLGAWPSIIKPSRIPKVKQQSSFVVDSGYRFPYFMISWFPYVFRRMSSIWNTNLQYLLKPKYLDVYVFLDAIIVQMMSASDSIKGVVVGFKDILLGLC